MSRAFFLAPSFIGYGIDRYPMTQIRLLASLVMVTFAVPPASAWNIPGHMLSAAIAYQILQQENPPNYREGKSSVFALGTGVSPGTVALFSRD